MRKEIIEIIQNDLDDLFEKEKMKTACVLNALIDANNSSKEYIRAIDEIKGLLGIKDTILELFR